jgi:hypothetical protein
LHNRNNLLQLFPRYLNLIYSKFEVLINHKHFEFWVNKRIIFVCGIPLSKYPELAKKIILRFFFLAFVRLVEVSWDQTKIESLCSECVSHGIRVGIAAGATKLKKTHLLLVFLKNLKSQEYSNSHWYRVIYLNDGHRHKLGYRFIAETYNFKLFWITTENS